MSFTSSSNKVEFKTSEETNKLMNELFDVNSTCRQKPYIERQLPKSFFVQPCGSGISLICDHHKGFSSPATLEETYRAGPGNDINYHSKQRSLDSQCNNQLYSDFKSSSSIGIKSVSPSIESSDQLKIEAGKLPPGYEMAVNELGRVYFLNHATKETTWFDPRLPEEIQRWGMSLKDLQDLHIHYIRSLSAGHASARKQSSITQPTRTIHQQFSQCNQGQNVPDSTNQKLFHRLLSMPGSNMGMITTDKGSTGLVNFKTSTGQSLSPHMQYMVTNNQGKGYNEMCHLYPNCSSIQGSLSHSSNSSCSNLSTCLNGLNLSPAAPPLIQTPGTAMMIPQCHYGAHIGSGQSIVDNNHSHQDSLDSGVGQSVVSQSYISTNVTSQHNDDNLSFDMPIKLEDCENLENSFDDNIDDFMDIDICSPNFC